jgi:hypothetical protein
MVNTDRHTKLKKERRTDRRMGRQTIRCLASIESEYIQTNSTTTEKIYRDRQTTGRNIYMILLEQQRKRQA